MAKVRMNKYGIAETKHTFKMAGIVFGTKSKNFYKEEDKKNSLFFGVHINNDKPLYCRLQGFIRDNVYFSKNESGIVETKKIPWKDRMKPQGSGFDIIGIRLGIEQDENDKNIVTNMTEYDAALYLSKQLHDGDKVLIIGDVEVYTKNDGTVQKNYVPKQIYTDNDIDFSASDFNEKALFAQTLVYTGLEKETDENGKNTGRVIMTGYDVAYQSICPLAFVLSESVAANAGAMRKKLKQFDALDISGHINIIVDVTANQSEDDGWGTPNELSGKRLNSPVRVEFVIDYANPYTIDSEKYNEYDVGAAIKKIKTEREARKNFGEKPVDNGVSVDAGDWNDDDDNDSDSPW